MIIPSHYKNLSPGLLDPILIVSPIFKKLLLSDSPTIGGNPGKFYLHILNSYSLFKHNLHKNKAKSSCGTNEDAKKRAKITARLCVSKQIYQLF